VATTLGHLFAEGQMADVAQNAVNRRGRLRALSSPTQSAKAQPNPTPPGFGQSAPDFTNSKWTTYDIWQRRTPRQLSDEDRRQIRENIAGFFKLLGEWERAERASLVRHE
jgi:hypothetical protein